MPNLFSDYHHIVTTYLEGLRAQENADFEFELDTTEGSVCFTKYSQAGHKLYVKYTFDKQDVEKENPGVEFLNIVLHTLRNELKELLKADAIQN